MTADDTGLPGNPKTRTGGPTTRPVRDPERERLARLDGDAPEVHPPDRFDGGLHDVVRPDRDAARDDQRIRAGLEPAAKSSKHIVKIVCGDPEVDRLAARGGDEGAQARPVRIGDPGGTGGLAGRPDLIARGQHGNPRAPVDREARPGARDQGDGRGGDGDPRRQECGAGLEIAPGDADGATGGTGS